MERDELLDKCRSAVANHDGHPYGGWSSREQLAVALVLNDQETLTEWAVTALGAIQMVRDGMVNPPADLASWLQEIRIQLIREGTVVPHA